MKWYVASDSDTSYESIQIPNHLRDLSGSYFWAQGLSEKVQVSYEPSQGRICLMRGQDEDNDLIFEQVYRVSVKDISGDPQCIGYELHSVDGLYRWRSMSLRNTMVLKPRSDMQKSQHQHYELKSVMTGRVVMINVLPGDQVKKDDCLVIVEAMKMENKIFSPVSGVVRSVTVREGESVAVGHVLCTFDLKLGV